MLSKTLMNVSGVTWMTLLGLLLAACNPGDGQSKVRMASCHSESSRLPANAPIRESDVWNEGEADMEGMAVMEGDILLQGVEQINAPDVEVGAQGVAIRGSRYRWTHATVPYTLDPKLPDRSRVIQAIAHWQSETSLRFVPRTASNAALYPNYITFRPANAGCTSRVGMIGGQQFINLATSCSMGSTLHEIGHAIGLWHEQSRKDRDSHVRIRWENIKANQRHNFDRPTQESDDVLGYDFDSIMHYGTDYFSANGQPTIESLNCQPIGQRNRLSIGDVNTVIKLYPRQVVVNDPSAHFQTWAALARAVVTGDFNGDGRTDLAAVGADDWATLPVALSNSNGSFRVVNESIPDFQTWASKARAVVTGDFNGDGLMDLAAVGADDWATLPVALSNGDGSFRVVNESIPDFQTWAAEAREVVTGDFNGDGAMDLAAVGANGWTALPVALSNRDGSFRVVNESIPHFQTWAAETRAVVTGDFNGDGRTDLAAVGASGWTALPVALANGDGSFRVVNKSIPHFQTWAAETREVVTGDFNGDGRMDLAAVGGNDWTALPVALSNGDGSFRVVNESIPDFQTWAAETRAVVTGDFNGDGRTDLAAVGANGWTALPVALANGDGSFRMVNESIPDFQTWASEAHAVVTGDFNGDGRMDLAAVGAQGRLALPVALLYH